MKFLFSLNGCYALNTSPKSCFKNRKTLCVFGFVLPVYSYSMNYDEFIATVSSVFICNTHPGNTVLLVKIEGPGAGIPSISIYHHLPIVKGVSSTPSINQPMGIWDIYASRSFLLDTSCELGGSDKHFTYVVWSCGRKGLRVSPQLGQRSGWSGTRLHHKKPWCSRRIPSWNWGHGDVQHGLSIRQPWDFGV